MTTSMQATELPAFRLPTMAYDDRRWSYWNNSRYKGQRAESVSNQGRSGGGGGGRRRRRRRKKTRRMRSKEGRGRKKEEENEADEKEKTIKRKIIAKMSRNVDDNKTMLRRMQDVDDEDDG